MSPVLSLLLCKNSRAFSSILEMGTIGTLKQISPLLLDKIKDDSLLIESFLLARWLPNSAHWHSEMGQPFFSLELAIDWGGEDEEALDWFTDYYNKLTAYYRDATNKGNAMLLCFG